MSSVLVAPITLSAAFLAIVDFVRNFGAKSSTESASVSECGGKRKTQQDPSADAAARERLISAPLVA